MIGFRIEQRKAVVASKWVEAFRGLPVANISDSMHRMFGGGAGLRPVHKSGYLCGPALTVATRPGDNLMLHKAIDLADPGDVIVVDGGGETSNALIGEMMIAHAINRGVAGVVIYGAVRDIDVISRGAFPVYASGVTHRGPYKDGPGEINTTIRVDGLVVHPGDLIVGDADGLLSVPMDAAETIYHATLRKQQAEAAQMARIADRTNDRSWVDAALREKGCTTGQ
ncbi:RraA family protein [Poseidonocella sedimentorum]|uniref:Putative 4-hydroxy-4-methyl-2-oxoglutarate aldolase n=1 Tax=Poseidonocella sedimentorum TaxID=871652 RepID=A0A1I6D7I4_9RHOB|nr:RraA family protein [Poseidonocella sedimentorum]SFR01430.1 Regulator of RNase E activity RraA [Poseidonocella sedimentorum]